MTSLKQQVSAVFSPGVSHNTVAAVLSVADLVVRYDRRVVLDHVSFQLLRGERVAVVGPNGAGKSTLFKVIAGLLPPAAGTISVYGHEPGGHICIAYIPQRSHVDWHFPVTVFDVVMMGRTRRIGLFRWPGRADRAYVSHCLDLVGMADLSHRQIGELSGGQQQRVFIARALAQEAELMLMDEPLTGLDITSQQEILLILDTLRQHHVTVLVATHDLNQAAEQFDRVMLLNRMLLGFGTAEEVFTIHHLASAYGGNVRVLNNQTGTTVMVDTCCDNLSDEEPI